MVRVLGMIGLSLTLWACSQPTQQVATCEVNSDCEALHRCNDEKVCEAVECTTAEDCGHGQFCDADYTCSIGCADNDDCLAGEECNSEHVCEPYGCRTTELDCTYGEYCNQSTGECYLDAQPHCQTCDITNIWGNECGTNGSCFYLPGDSCNTAADCPTGYKCDSLDGFTKTCHIDSCYMQCNPSSPDACPRGFSCMAMGDGVNYCVGDCEFMTTGGYL